MHATTDELKNESMQRLVYDMTLVEILVEKGLITYEEFDKRKVAMQARIDQEYEKYKRSNNI